MTNYDFFRTFARNYERTQDYQRPRFRVPRGLLYDVVRHPLMQRLNRINQLGLASVVYPGARHTRFQHSLGAFYLMSEAVKSLQEKGIYIFDSEAEAVEAAILMHDIGHGPFSHVLENTLIKGISHEDISLMMMEQINHDLKGQLALAISIFKDDYPNQLDMDRLDYLRRDSFFTGVTEGNIGSARIIKMLNVKDSKLVVEVKGIYSIENFLTTRRLMYWQVYLHKTAVGYEKILISALKRAKMLTKQGYDIFAAPALAYFLKNDVDRTWFEQHPEALTMYSELDDSDIWSALKAWKHSDDRTLSLLAESMLDRHLWHVEVSEERPSQERLDEIVKNIAKKEGISLTDATYLMSLTEIGKDMYNPDDDSIGILYKDGTIKDISEASEILNVQLLSKKIRKYYLCYQRF